MNAGTELKWLILVLFVLGIGIGLVTAEIIDEINATGACP